MSRYARKGWEVKGYTYHAAAYCKACGDGLPDIDPEGNDKHAVFVMDECGEGEACDTCGKECADW